MSILAFRARLEPQRVFLTMKLTAGLLTILTALLSNNVYGQSYKVVTIAGSDTVRDGFAATTSLLHAPEAAAIDSAGNLYIADYGANRVRKVSPSGIITTVAGGGWGGYSGDGGPASEAEMDGPIAVAVDRRNNLYIADYNNNYIRKVAAGTGIISTVAGNGSSDASGDGGPAIAAGFDPAHVAVDSAGNLYISDFINDRVRKVDAKTGIITTVAGSGVTGYSGDTGAATVATLNGPTAVAVDSAGVLYICDQWNHAIRKVGTDGKIATLVGNGSYGDEGDHGPTAQAALVLPDTIALDSTGTKLYISNFDRIRVVDLASAIISAFAGSGDIGFSGDGGGALGAMFRRPLGLAVAMNGDVYIADTGNYRVRRVHNGLIETIAGSNVKDGGAATSAYLASPEAVQPLANGDFVIADTGNNRIRKVPSVDDRIVTFAGTGMRGTTSGRIASPSSMCLDPSGNIIFLDFGNSRIQRTTPQGAMSTIAGSSTARTGFAGDGGLATSALLKGPTSVACDSAGNIYIADSGNNRVRKVDGTTQIITTVAGNGQTGATGIGGAATSAPVTPIALAVDAGGNLFIADARSRVLKVAASSGVISMFAGTGAAGYSGDGGPALSAKMFMPSGLAFDSAATSTSLILGTTSSARSLLQGSSAPSPETEIPDSIVNRARPWKHRWNRSA